MNRQQTFASVAKISTGKVTCREYFLAKTAAAIPRSDLVALVAPHHPHADRGRQPLPLEVALRVRFLQQ